MLTAAVVLGFGMLAASSNAADDEKEVREVIQKMAGAIEQGKEGDAKKMADKLKNADLEDIMNLMLPRKAGGKGGVGIGAKPGAITPDGIERKVQALEKAAPPEAEIPDLEKAGYIMKAIALATPNKVPKGKNPKNWSKYNDDYQKTAQEFIEAAKKKDPKAVQAAAKKLNNACVSCHNDYK
jgi:cytochrome c556